MLIVHTPDELRAYVRDRRAAGGHVALVPTMGALHRGHGELIRAATTVADTVVVSVYVNPRQFNVASDFERYPRDLASDVAAAAASGATVVYAPHDSVMYPEGFDTTVSVRGVAAPLEGAGRPGHFDGVATVVAKLLNACDPDTAVFGLKDYQQVAVVRRMVRDLDMDVQILAVDTVRELDGLALSSRNVRLSPEDRAAAPVVHRGLLRAREVLEAGGDARSAREEYFAVVGESGRARVEYVSVADPDTLTEIEGPTLRAVISCAVWFGDVRLIDNVIHGVPGAP
jgi:pantoate--beta-alanine ligase